MKEKYGNNKINNLYSAFTFVLRLGWEGRPVVPQWNFSIIIIIIIIMPYIITCESGTHNHNHKTNSREWIFCLKMHFKTAPSTFVLTPSFSIQQQWMDPCVVYVCVCDCLVLCCVVPLRLITNFLTLCVSLILNLQIKYRNHVSFTFVRV